MEKQRRNDRVTDQQNHLPIQPPCDPRGGRALLDGSNPSKCEIQHDGRVDHIRNELAYDYHVTLAYLYDDPERDFDLNLKK